MNVSVLARAAGLFFMFSLNIGSPLDGFTVSDFLWHRLHLNAKAILQLLKEINQSMGITVVIITHEMAVIEAVCDRVAIIDKSHIAEIGEVSRVFAEPKSKIGRQLILGDAAEKVEFGTGRLFRIIFDGLASSEPVISNVVLACKVPVNIMYAATRDIKGKAAGQMIIELPDHEPDIERVLQYLDRAKVPYEEVGKNEL